MSQTTLIIIITTTVSLISGGFSLNADHQAESRVAGPAHYVETSGTAG